jgi:hypothetical protein
MIRRRKKLVAPVAAGKPRVDAKRKMHCMSNGRSAITACLVLATLGGCSGKTHDDATHSSHSSAIPEPKETSLSRSVTHGTSNMIKLYKTTEQGTRHYWEAWQNKGVVIVHSGVIGDTGERRKIQVAEGMDAAAVIEEEAIATRRDGFRELPQEEQVSFIIQYRLDNWGSEEDLEKRYAVEDVMNECLGWTGNGMCDGGDIGSGTINIWCFVVDPQIAAKTALESLRKKKLADGAIMAYVEDDKDIVLWPKDFSGKFSAL